MVPKTDSHSDSDTKRDDRRKGEREGFNFKWGYRLAYGHVRALTFETLEPDILMKPIFLAWPPLQSLAVKKKNFFLRKFWAVKNF